MNNLSPEERRAKIQELREKHGPFSSAGLTNRTDGFKNLSPEERRAKMEEMRKAKGGRHSLLGTNSLSPEQRRERLNTRLEQLRQKKAEGSLDPAEQKQLDRLEQFNQHFQSGKGQPAGKENKPAQQTNQSKTNSSAKPE